MFFEEDTDWLGGLVDEMIEAECQMREDLGQDKGTEYAYPSGLDAPITDTSLLFYQWAITGDKPNRLSSFSRCGSHKAFVSDMRSTERDRTVAVDLSSTHFARVVGCFDDFAHSAPRPRAVGDPKYRQAALKVVSDAEKAVELLTGGNLPACGSESSYEEWYDWLYSKLQKVVWNFQAQGKGSPRQTWEISIPYQTQTRSGSSTDAARMVKLVVNMQHTAFLFPDDQLVYVGPQTLFLNIFTGVACRRQTLRANRHLAVLSETTIHDVFRWQTRTVSKGNWFYEVVKNIEALAITFLSKREGLDLTFTSPYDKMRAKVHDKCVSAARKHGFEMPVDQEDNEILNELEAILEPLPVAHIVEVYGLQKTTGFPIVLVRVGGKKLRENVQGHGAVSLPMAIKLEYTYCHLTLKNFIARTGSWPRLEFNRKGLELEKLWQSDAATLPDGSYNLDEWAFVEFTQMYEFKEYADLLPFIMDKSCSPGETAMRKQYEGGGMRDAINGRLVTATLARTDLDPVLLVDAFSRGEYKNRPTGPPLAVFKDKNGEFKVTPRVYCMLPPEDRYPLGIIQENVKKGPFKDLPYQTMSLTREETQSLVWGLNSGSIKDHLGRDLARAVISIDFSSWNSKFRDTLTRRVGIRMDQQFGRASTFGKIHDYFSSCKILVSEPGERVEMFEPGPNPPDVDPADLEWCYTYLGGAEGIDQATWTAITICMIHEALDKYNVKFRLIGQGDNQVLILDFLDVLAEDLETVSRIVTQIMAEIDIVSFLVGHEAKPEEFISSRSVFTYSKQVFVEGKEYPTELKFAGKTGPFPESSHSSLADAVGSVFSSCSASAERAAQPLRHYTLALETSLAAMRVYETSQFDGNQNAAAWLRTATVDELRLLVTTPSVLGGFPVLGPTAFMIRGEPDSLGSAIAGLKVLTRADALYSKTYTYLGRPESWRDPDTLDMTSLVKDPESIPLKKLASGAAVREQAALNIMRGITKNPLFTEATIIGDGELDSVMTEIGKMRPMYPHLASDLAALSLAGVVKKITRKFAHSRTLTQLASEDFETTMRSDAGDAAACNSAMAVVRSVGDQLTAKVGFLSHRVDELCSRYRERWGIGPVFGVTTSHPIDWPLSTDPQSHGVKLVGHSALVDLRDRGPYTPFLGSTTDDRRTEKVYETKDTSGIDDLAKLVIAYTSGAMAGAKSLFESVLRTRGVPTLDDACLLLPRVVGGSISHRYGGFNRQMRSGPLGTLNVGSHYKFNTDDIPGMSASKVDKPVAVQAYFSYLLAVARLLPQVPDVLVSVLDASVLPDLMDDPVTTAGVVPAPRFLPSSRVLRIDPIEIKSPLVERHNLNVTGVGLMLSRKRGPVEVLTAVLLDSAYSEMGSSLMTTVAIQQSHAVPGLGAVELASVGPLTLREAMIDSGVVIASDYLLRQRSVRKKQAAAVAGLSAASTVAAGLVTRSMQNLLKIESVDLSGLGAVFLSPGSTEPSMDAVESVLAQRVGNRLSRIMTGEWRPRPVPLVQASIGVSPAKQVLRRLGPGVLHAASLRRLEDKKAQLPMIAARGSIGLLRTIYNEEEWTAKTTKNQLHQGRYAARMGLARWGDPIHYSAYVDEFCLEFFQAESWTTVEGTVTEAVRALRDYTSPTIPSSLLTSNLGAAPKIEIKWKERSVLPELPPDLGDDPNNDHESIAARVGAKIGCTFGIATSIIPRWIPILRDTKSEYGIHGTAAVVGTGRGAIQAALSIIGIPSVGYDLPAALPPAVLAMKNPRPVEVKNLALEGATFATEPRLDWTSSSSDKVFSSNPDLIIVDVEGPSVSDVLLPFERLTPPRRTYVVVKLLVDESGANAVTDWLSTRQGADLLKVRLAGGCLDNRHRSQVVFSFVWTRPLSSDLKKMGDSTQLGEWRPVIPAQLDSSLYSRWEMLILRVNPSGVGLVVPASTKVRDLSRHIKTQLTALRAHFVKTEDNKNLARIRVKAERTYDHMDELASIAAEVSSIARTTSGLSAVGQDHTVAELLANPQPPAIVQTAVSALVRRVSRYTAQLETNKEFRSRARISAKNRLRFCLKHGPGVISVLTSADRALDHHSTSR